MGHGHLHEELLRARSILEHAPQFLEGGSQETKLWECSVDINYNSLVLETSQPCLLERDFQHWKHQHHFQEPTRKGKQYVNICVLTATSTYLFQTCGQVVILEPITWPEAKIKSIQNKYVLTSERAMGRIGAIVPTLNDNNINISSLDNLYIGNYPRHPNQHFCWHKENFAVSYQLLPNLLHCH